MKHEHHLSEGDANANYTAVNATTFYLFFNSNCHRTCAIFSSGMNEEATMSSLQTTFKITLTVQSCVQDTDRDRNCSKIHRKNILIIENRK